ncbi:hypothetical protein GQ600_2207 [Phytophthora cactorum]|nr:hypothetical protein GQ600_2207 [Phytophthora cactorum]
MNDGVGTPPCSRSARRGRVKRSGWPSRCAQRRIRMNMAQANVQAMFGSPQQQSNLYFMGSQPMAPQSLQLPVQQHMASMAMSVPKSQAQHMQMQIQQRQQQQQYAAALAARRNAQQLQQVAAMAAMMGQQLCGSCFIVQQNRASPEDLTKGGPHALSVRRAILCVNLETNSNSNFDKFGHLASLRLGEIGSVPKLLKRACIAHGLHDNVIELMKARKFSAMDFFGWHPAIEGPNVRCSSLCAICGIRNAPEVDMCSRCHHKLVFPSVFTKYISTLLAAFYAEQVGIPLGASTLDVFAHTNTVRELYKGLRPFDADGVTWDMLRMIFGLLDIMSNFGTLQLNPDLFVPEMNIIFNAAYVNQAMITNEFEVVGKFLQCMRLFGDAKSKEKENMIESCERYLLFKHLPNGSWCKINGSTVDQYKATVTCSKEMGSQRSSKLPSAAMPGGKQPADSTKLKLLVSGATVKTNTQARLKRLEAMYKKLDAQSKAAAEGKSVKKEESSTVKVEAGNAAHREEKEETPVKKEEGTAESTTDSEDVKSEHHDQSGSTDDDDMLTSMSLHEDLEIFDGLQFEDGGGIIDMNFPSLGPQGDTEEHTMEDVDGTDGPGQDDDEDETMDEHVVDDDEDETEDNGSHAAGESPQQDTQVSSTEGEAMEIAGSGASDFPEM